MNTDNILITEKDYLRLNNLLSTTEDHDPENRNFEDLEVELERATIISDKEVPNDLVTMNSKLRYLDASTEKESLITIVYPENANTDKGQVSILSPIGSALIGLRKGQEINWKFPFGKTKKLKVIEVIYQPEAHEDWHL